MALAREAGPRSTYVIHFFMEGEAVFSGSVIQHNGSKGAREREVRIGPTTARELWKYIQMYRAWLVQSERERHVFLGHGSVPQSSSTR